MDVLGAGGGKKPSWRNSECKKLLKQLVNDNLIEETLPPREVYKLPEFVATFQVHDYEQFCRGLREIRKLKKNNPPAAAAPPPPGRNNNDGSGNNNSSTPGVALGVSPEDTPRWQGSECAEILTRLVLEGKIPRNRFGPQDVYNMAEYCEIFHRHNYLQFRDNLANIRRTVRSEAVRADVDAAFVANDRAIHPVRYINQRGAIRWPESAACEALETDVTEILENVRNGGVQPLPRQLWNSRPEYQNHSLPDFRDHYYQELRKRRGKSYWMHRKSREQEDKNRPHTTTDEESLMSKYPVLLSAEDLLFIGLKWLSPAWDDQKQRKLGPKLTKQRFVSCFGTTPETLEQVYADLKAGPMKNNLDHYYLFITLFWLKNNMAIPAIALIFDSSERSVGTYMWKYAKALQSLKDKKISLDETFDGEEIFVLTVDGVHFRTRECRIDPNKNWYSHKSNGPGLSYELGIAIHDNKLCWINGPFRASVHDATMFASGEGDFNDPITKFRSPSGLAEQIPHGKKLLGDKGGYQSFKTAVSIRNRQDSREVKEFKARALSRHETFNGRIKNWKVLRERWEYSLDKHVIAMEAICVLEQYRMGSDNPLFEV